MSETYTGIYIYIQANHIFILFSTRNALMDTETYLILSIIHISFFYHNCTSALELSFNGKIRKEFRGSNFQTGFTVRSNIHCFTKCQQKQTCMSYNYNDGDKLCEFIEVKYPTQMYDVRFVHVIVKVGILSLFSRWVLVGEFKIHEFRLY